ncbi:hypothetical protein BLOT_002968 [Blomia tropicalis]|nr:hypothetical protein BLOT_002968 [Blomia tropicalis]
MLLSVSSREQIFFSGILSPYAPQQPLDSVSATPSFGNIHHDYQVIRQNNGMTKRENCQCMPTQETLPITR